MLNRGVRLLANDVVVPEVQDMSNLLEILDNGGFVTYVKGLQPL